MHADYDDCPQHRINIAKDFNGVGGGTVVSAKISLLPHVTCPEGGVTPPPPLLHHLQELFKLHSMD